ncbi:MAG: helix-turn-helix domain-containing protein [Hyphomonas sp.]
MKNKDARIFELCRHLRSALDVFEQIADEPYAPPAKVASPPSIAEAFMKQEVSAKKLAYTVKKAATALVIGRTTVWRAISEGELAAVKLGSRTLIPSEALRTWIGSFPRVRS